MPAGKKGGGGIEPIHIQLDSSQCGRNEFYLRRIDETARRLGLEYCLEQVTDEAALEERGIDLDCLKGYCPGCRQKHAPRPGREPDAVYAPALAINGEIVFSDYPPDDRGLEKLLERWAPGVAGSAL